MTGSNIITLGDGNVVNTEFADLRNVLDELKDAISTNRELNDSQKLDYSVDIESIKDQLAKTKPNRNVIGQLWEGLGKLAIIFGIADIYTKAASYIQGLLS